MRGVGIAKLGLWVALGLVACYSPPAVVPQPKTQAPPGSKDGAARSSSPASKPTATPHSAAASAPNADSPEPTLPVVPAAPEPTSARLGDLAVLGDTLVAVGNTNGSLLQQPHLGGSDAWVARLDATDGSVKFAHQFGTNTRDTAHHAAIVGEYFYLVGATGGSLDGKPSLGGRDAFLQKRQLNDGAVQWTVQFGSPRSDAAWFVVLDQAANPYVVGVTAGSMAKSSNQGKSDVFAQKYSPDGTLLWITQLGTNGEDTPKSVRLDPKGQLHILQHHELNSLERDVQYGWQRQTQLSLVRLEPNTGVVTSALRLSHAAQEFALAANGANLALTVVPVSTANDIVASQPDEWIVSGGIGRDRGDCPIHDGSDPFVQKFGVKPLKRRWEQGALVEPNLISMFESQSASLSAPVLHDIYEAGFTSDGTGTSDLDVYVRKLDFDTGKIRWLTRLSGSMQSGPLVRADRNTVALGWTSVDESVNTDTAQHQHVHIRRVNTDTGAVLWSKELSAEVSSVVGTKEPDESVSFCGGTYSPFDATVAVCSSKDPIDLSPLVRLPKLVSLIVTHSRARDISLLGKLTTLRRLDLTDSNISDLSVLHPLTELESLNLSLNPFTSLAPLRALHKLRKLRIDRTGVVDLSPLRDLPALDSLDLSWTKAKDLSALHDIKALKRVMLPLSLKEQAEKLVAARPHLVYWNEDDDDTPEDVDSSEETQFDLLVQAAEEAEDSQ